MYNGKVTNALVASALIPSSLGQTELDIVFWGHSPIRTPTTFHGRKMGPVNCSR